VNEEGRQDRGGGCAWKNIRFRDPEFQNDGVMCPKKQVEVAGGRGKGEVEKGGGGFLGY